MFGTSSRRSSPAGRSGFVQDCRTCKLAAGMHRFEVALRREECHVGIEQGVSGWRRCSRIKDGVDERLIEHGVASFHASSMTCLSLRPAVRLVDAVAARVLDVNGAAEAGCAKCCASVTRVEHDAVEVVGASIASSRMPWNLDGHAESGSRSDGVLRATVRRFPRFLPRWVGTLFGTGRLLRRRARWIADDAITRDCLSVIRQRGSRQELRRPVPRNRQRLRALSHLARTDADGTCLDRAEVGHGLEGSATVRPEHKERLSRDERTRIVLANSLVAAADSNRPSQQSGSLLRPGGVPLDKPLLIHVNSLEARQDR